MSTIYDILRRPLVTEKSSYQSGRLNQYSFIVADAATRQQVKDAIETLYDVKCCTCEYYEYPCQTWSSPSQPPLACSKSWHKEGYYYSG